MRIPYTSFSGNKSIKVALKSARFKGKGVTFNSERSNSGIQREKNVGIDQ